MCPWSFDAHGPCSKKHIPFLLGVCLLFFLPMRALGQEAVIKEEFEDLSQWKELLFHGIEKLTRYEVIQEDGGSVLQARSDGSASALICRQQFDVYEYPLLSWTWKVENIYKKGDATSKQGDDYPLRIYVLFAFDPEQAGTGQRLKYRLAKILYGEYPPDSTLNYIWANTKHRPEVLINPYTDRARMFPLRFGKDMLGQWLTEQRNILDDYRRAFGQDPPAMASLAVMNDSDNTRESSVSYLDRIQVFQRMPPDGRGQGKDRGISGPSGREQKAKDQKR